MRSVHPFEIIVANNLRDATRASDIVVTTTSARKAFLGIDDVSPGAFIAAVGADNEEKQEIDVGLLRRSVVIADDLDQCAAILDLHHALLAGALSKSDVRATLAELAAGRKLGRLSEEEIVFDSTGVAMRT